MEIREIPINQIETNEQRIRCNEADDDVRELALDIQRHGLLQPIGVTPGDKGTYKLLWGSRRLRAHRYLKRRTVQARIVMPDDVESVKSVAMRENVHRLQMSLAEEVDTVRFLHEVEGRSVEQICEMLGKSRNWVLRRLALPGLPPELVDLVMSDKLPIGHAELLAQIQDQNAAMMMAYNALNGAWTLAQLREAIAAYNAAPNVEEAVEAGVQEVRRIREQGGILIQCAGCGRAVGSDQVIIRRLCYCCDEVFPDLYEAYNGELQKLEESAYGNDSDTSTDGSTGTGSIGDGMGGRPNRDGRRTDQDRSKPAKAD